MTRILYLRKVSCLTASIALMVLITRSSYAQVQRPLLDVYKIAYGFYLEATDTSYASEVQMHIAQEQMEKAHWKTLLVYAHPGYLYAEDIMPDNQKTIWLLHYRTKRLEERMGRKAILWNFDDVLKTNVYRTGEQVADSTYGYGLVTFSDDTMTVAGYVCKRATIQYTKKAWGDGDTKGETVVWYCPQLPRFYLPGYEYLQKIPGAALLEWHDRGYGEVKGIVAKTIEKQKKPVSFFRRRGRGAHHDIAASNK